MASHGYDERRDDAARRAMLIAVVATLLALGAGRAAAIGFGTLSNFDVVNDTSGPCHGFEIELEDIHVADVPYTFGGTYIRYGTPEILDTTVDPMHPRVLVRYRHWNGSAWEATPVAAPNITPGGHDCYAGGPIGNYESSGCEHFGASLNASPTRTSYRWIIASNPADIASSFSAAPEPVNVPVPVLNVVPAQVGGGGVKVQAELEPVEEENAARFGEPQWMKVFKVESELDLQPEDLVKLLLGAAGNILPGETEVETEWKLIQSKPGNAEGDQEDADVKEDPLDAGKHSVIRRYEFFAFTGPRDAENNEALPCVDDGTPVAADAPVGGCSDLGDFVGAQNVALDLDLAAIDSELPTGEVDVIYPHTALLVGGRAPYAVTVTGDPVPAGLSLDTTTAVLSGKPTADGVFSFTIDGEDAATDAVHATFNLTIVPAVTIDTAALPVGVLDECYAATVSASGGLPPFTWADIGETLPSWAETTDNSDISGCPHRKNDIGISSITFRVTDGLGGTSTKTLDLEIAGAPAATATATVEPITPTPTVTASPSVTPGLCAGNCNGDASVTIDELITMVNIALERMAPSACQQGIPAGTQVDIALLIRSVRNGLLGCGR